MNKSRIDEQIQKKQEEKHKLIYNHFLIRRGDITESTEKLYREIFGDIWAQEGITAEHITKPTSSIAGRM